MSAKAKVARGSVANRGGAGRRARGRVNAGQTYKVLEKVNNNYRVTEHGLSLKDASDIAQLIRASGGSAKVQAEKKNRGGGMTSKEKSLIRAGGRMALAQVAPLASMMANKGKKNPKRRNPEDTAAARFEDFHGEPAKKVLEWNEDYHYHGVTSDIGKLVSCSIALPRARSGGVVEIAGLKGARLTMNEAGTQLFVEGGDQSLDLAQFGVKTEHDREYLGELAKVTYHTNKTHLGHDGGKADYVHTFGRMESSRKKTERPQVFYDVINEEILIAGGGYEIPSEGIDG